MVITYTIFVTCSTQAALLTSGGTLSKQLPPSSSPSPSPSHPPSVPPRNTQPLRGYLPCSSQAGPLGLNISNEGGAGKAGKLLVTRATGQAETLGIRIKDEVVSLNGKKCQNKTAEVMFGVVVKHTFNGIQRKEKSCRQHFLLHRTPYTDHSCLWPPRSSRRWYRSRPDP
jgi:hypothetical protein